tara:strand:- start:599 stop:1453 length:855 start_codon:yes stop_codon:yes gene_type:complete
MLKILRIEQWSKNLVIFLPAIFANKFTLIIDEKLMLVFLGFSLIASSTYIFNDIKDVDQDKEHPIKKFRPLAKGDISIQNAKIYSLSLYFIGFGIVYFTSKYATIFLILYTLITVLYSNFFKYKKYLDFLAITVLFGVRLFLGSYLTGIVLTNALSFFILSTINQIIVSKKISIINNYDIDPNVKVKKYLLHNYRNKELNKIFNLSLILSLTILFFWSIQWFDGGVFQVFVSILNFSSLCFFNYIFYGDTYRSETEDFIYWIKNSKMFFPMIISGLAVITLLYL